MKVDEILATGSGGRVSAAASSPTPELVGEMVQIYWEIYAPGLTSFFENQWYNLRTEEEWAEHHRGEPQVLPNPISTLTDNAHVFNAFHAFHQSISNITSTAQADLVQSGHLERAFVWALITIPRSGSPPPFVRPAGQLPTAHDTLEARGRMAVLEALLSGETLPSNPLTAPPLAIKMNEPRTNTDLEFWYYIGEFVRQSTRVTASNTSNREYCLSRMREVLLGRENRDVLYSIAILREHTRNIRAEEAELSLPDHLDERNPAHKVAVATRFIRDMKADGTTNVIRRVADIAYWAYVRPGYSVMKNEHSD